MSAGRFYVDASVVLRVLLRQPGQLPEWSSIQTPLASEIIAVEVPRVVDRLRADSELQDTEAALALAAGHQLLRRFELVDLTRAVLQRAGQSFATRLATLDGIHFATALMWRSDHPNDEITIATHDDDLALAALVHDVPFVGVDRAELERRLREKQRRL